jgi:hypothetical protein
MFNIRIKTINQISLFFYIETVKDERIDLNVDFKTVVIYITSAFNHRDIIPTSVLQATSLYYTNKF